MSGDLRAIPRCSAVDPRTGGFAFCTVICCLSSNCRRYSTTSNPFVGTSPQPPVACRRCLISLFPLIRCLHFPLEGTYGQIRLVPSTARRPATGERPSLTFKGAEQPLRPPEAPQPPPQSGGSTTSSPPLTTRPPGSTSASPTTSTTKAQTLQHAANCNPGAATGAKAHEPGEHYSGPRRLLHDRPERALRPERRNTIKSPCPCLNRGHAKGRAPLLPARRLRHDRPGVALPVQRSRRPYRSTEQFKQQFPTKVNAWVERLPGPSEERVDEETCRTPDQRDEQEAWAAILEFEPLDPGRKKKRKANIKPNPSRASPRHGTDGATGPAACAKRAPRPRNSTTQSPTARPQSRRGQSCSMHCCQPQPQRKQQ